MGCRKSETPKREQEPAAIDWSWLSVFGFLPFRVSCFGLCLSVLPACCVAGYCCAIISHAGLRLGRPPLRRSREDVFRFPACFFATGRVTIGRNPFPSHEGEGSMAISKYRASNIAILAVIVHHISGSMFLELLFRKGQARNRKGDSRPPLQPNPHRTAHPLSKTATRQSPHLSIQLASRPM